MRNVFVRIVVKGVNEVTDSNVFTYICRWLNPPWWEGIQTRGRTGSSPQNCSQPNMLWRGNGRELITTWPERLISWQRVAGLQWNMRQCYRRQTAESEIQFIDLQNGPWTSHCGGALMHKSRDSVESYSITINLFSFYKWKKKKKETFAFLVFYTVKVLKLRSYNAFLIYKPCSRTKHLHLREERGS